jgi:hypothetical protein
MNAESNGETTRYLKLGTHRGFTHLELLVHRKYTLDSRTPPHAGTQGVVPELLTCGARWGGLSALCGTQQN